MQPHPQSEIGVAMDVRLGLRVASVGSRALAQLIDLTLLQVLQAVLGCIGGFGIAGAAAAGVEIGWLVAALVLVITLASGAWFVVYEIAWHGQTPGKRWVGLRVVTDEGHVPDAGAIVIRNAMRLVDFLPGGYLIGLLAMLASPQSRRLGDIVAGTLVIVEEKPPPAARRWPDGLGDAQIRLLEVWFARVATLPDERREPMAARLLDRLGRPVDPALGAVGTLEALCPREP